jgi:hypothetical protein
MIESFLHRCGHRARVAPDARPTAASKAMNGEAACDEGKSPDMAR